VIAESDSNSKFSVCHQVTGRAMAQWRRASLAVSNYSVSDSSDPNVLGTSADLFELGPP